MPAKSPSKMEAYPPVVIEFYVSTMAGHLSSTVCTLLAPASAGQAVIFKPQNDFQALSVRNASFPVNLGPLYNNGGFGMKPNESSFDGQTYWPALASVGNTCTGFG